MGSKFERREGNRGVPSSSPLLPSPFLSLTTYLPFTLSRPKAEKETMVQMKTIFSSNYTLQTVEWSLYIRHSIQATRSPPPSLLPSMPPPPIFIIFPHHIQYIHVAAIIRITKFNCEVETAPVPSLGPYMLNFICN